MDDQKIIELFFARSEAGIKELDAKYGKYFRELSYSILNNKQDAEECVNDAYIGVWYAIPPKNPNPLLTFVCKIVRNVSINRYNHNKAQKRYSEYLVSLEELGDIISDKTTVADEIAEEELIGYIEEFLDTQTKENRVIFMRRYWFSDSYDMIARRTGISKRTVSVRLTRMRSKLKIFLKERGIEV